MHRIPYLFLIVAGGLSLATFFTSQTLAEDAVRPIQTAAVVSRS